MRHFSHPHPLRIYVVQEEDGIFCSGSEYDLSGSAYKCTKSQCNFFLHKTCFELPREITHKSHPEHPLILLSSPPYEGGYFTCNICGDDGTTFTYHCSTCKKYNLHGGCTSAEAVNCENQENSTNSYPAAHGGYASSSETMNHANYEHSINPNPTGHGGYAYMPQAVYCEDKKPSSYSDLAAQLQMKRLQVQRQMMRYAEESIERMGRIGLFILSNKGFRLLGGYISTPLWPLGTQGADHVATPPPWDGGGEIPQRNGKTGAASAPEPQEEEEGHGMTTIVVLVKAAGNDLGGISDWRFEQGLARLESSDSRVPPPWTILGRATAYGIPGQEGKGRVSGGGVRRCPRETSRQQGRGLLQEKGQSGLPERECSHWWECPCHRTGDPLLKGLSTSPSIQHVPSLLSYKKGGQPSQGTSTPLRGNNSFSLRTPLCH